MTDLSALLATLQHGDSFFPSGAIAFSHGLETLRADGEVTTADEVERFILGQLWGRWASCDRAILTAAYHAGADLDRVEHADRLLDAIALPRELREGSRRTGAALLGVHVDLGTHNARAYRERTDTDEALGHLSAVQGLVWRGIGLSLDEAGAAAVHALCIALLGAALRLSVIGHVSAQRLLGGLRPALVQLLAQEPPSLDEIHTFAPLPEIAVMRHETQTSRLFSN